MISTKKGKPLTKAELARLRAVEENYKAALKLMQRTLDNLWDFDRDDLADDMKVFLNRKEYP